MKDTHVRFSDAAYDDDALLCPRCGNFNLHHIENATKVATTEILIGFWCEHCDTPGHRGVSLLIEQHKGTTFVRWRR